MTPEARKTLIKALQGRKTFHYLYGVVDSWANRIKVVKTLSAGASHQVPYCVEGANACPPEDVGGGSGYAKLLEAMADPNHSEHKSMMEWYGHDFDSTVFEWERIN